MGCRYYEDGKRPPVDAKKAGRWGDYECDVPHRTFRSMLEFIRDQNLKEEIVPKFITLTGDYGAHEVWASTFEQVYSYTVNMTNTFKEVLGTNIPVIPALGNHDLWPADDEDFTDAYNPIITSLKNVWYGDQWLSRAEMHKFMKYGYYSKPFPGSHKGKIIVLNTNAGYQINRFLAKDNFDPGH